MVDGISSTILNGKIILLLLVGATGWLDRWTPIMHMGNMRPGTDLYSCPINITKNGH